MRHKIKDVRIWGVGETLMERQDYTNAKKDDDGNYLMTIVLENYGEPIDYRSLRVPKVGDILEGEVVPYTSSNGNERLYFQVDKKDDRSARLSSQWAVGRALENCPDHEDKTKIKELAELYLHIVEDLIGRN